jgi:hypothetical protein
VKYKHRRNGGVLFKEIQGRPHTWRDMFGRKRGGQCLSRFKRIHVHPIWVPERLAAAEARPDAESDAPTKVM